MTQANYVCPHCGSGQVQRYRSVAFSGDISDVNTNSVMKNVITVIIALITMFSCIGCSGASQGKNSSQSIINTEQTEKNSVAVIQNAMGCSEQSAKKYYAQLKLVEFVPVIKMVIRDNRENTNGEIFSSWTIVCGNGGYSARIPVNETKEQIIFLEVLNADELMYKGQVKGKLSETAIIESERGKYISAAHLEVEKLLAGQNIKDFRLEVIENYPWRPLRWKKKANRPYELVEVKGKIIEAGSNKGKLYTVELDETGKVKYAKVWHFDNTSFRYSLIAEAKYN